MESGISMTNSSRHPNADSNATFKYANEIGGRGFKHDPDRLQASVTLSLQTVCIGRIRRFSSNFLDLGSIQETNVLRPSSEDLTFYIDFSSDGTSRRRRYLHSETPELARWFLQEFQWATMTSPTISTPGWPVSSKLHNGFCMTALLPSG